MSRDSFNTPIDPTQLPRAPQRAGIVAAPRAQNGIVAALAAPVPALTLPAPLFQDNQGKVLTSVKVQLIFWGSAWSSNPSPSRSDIEAAVQAILAGPYMSGLAQYRQIGPGSFHGSILAPSTPPNPFTDLDVFNMIQDLIKARSLQAPGTDNQLLYCVFLPKGVAVKVEPNQSLFTGEHTCFVYHDSNNNPTNMHFAWVTDGTMNDASLDDLTTVFSHELVESCTDPEGDGFRNMTGACQQTGWCEIGDVCDVRATVDGVTVQAYWSEADRACIVPLQFPITNADPQPTTDLGERCFDPTVS